MSVNVVESSPDNPHHESKRSAQVLSLLSIFSKDGPSDIFNKLYNDLIIKRSVDNKYLNALNITYY